MKKILVLFLLVAFILATGAFATTDCVFNNVGSTMFLQGNCMTDETLFVPDGFTLDGQYYTISAFDPAGDHFKGAVIQNGGTVANVKNLKLQDVKRKYLN